MAVPKETRGLAATTVSRNAILFRMDSGECVSSTRQFRTMRAERWKPSVTVAAIIEKDGRYLMIEELTRDGLRINNPAGGLEPGESIVDGVIREALEETACRFTPEALLGVYLA